MITIDDFIKSQYLEVNETMWSASGVFLFRDFLKEEHNAEYTEIMNDIDFSDLINAVGTNDLINQSERAYQQIINEFKKHIREWVGELQGEIEDKEEIRQEFNDTEARGFNNESI